MANTLDLPAALLDPALWLAFGTTVAVPVADVGIAASVTCPFLTVEYGVHMLLGAIGWAEGVAPWPCWNVEVP